jgi:hypothetical protein
MCPHTDDDGLLDLGRIRNREGIIMLWQSDTRETVRHGAARRPSKLSAWLITACTLTPLLLVTSPASAIPAFARQMGLECTACHTAYPQLNAFGREFKLNGYTESAGKVPWYKKLALMTEPSFTHTASDLSEPPKDFGDNNNFAFTQTSVFFGGKIAGKLGGFVQATYDGVGRVFSWDNADFRFADTASIKGKPLVWGIDLNNNPTVQDLWNSTPAWGYPFSASGIAPTPAAATLIQSLGGQVAGLGAYLLWNDLVYVGAAAYHTLDDGTLRALGVSPLDVSAKIDGAAPYWRVALQHEWGPHYLEGGTFGMAADTLPEGDRSAGHDHFTDIGLDLQYQYAHKVSDVALRVSWIHEQQDLSAGYRLGFATNASNDLSTFNGNVSYLYDKTWQFTAGYTNLRGDADPAYYGTDSGSPDSNWATVQLDWLPYNKHGGPSLWPWFNPKLSVQYLTYDRFDGTTSAASDNNTLYLQAWLVF